jgi:hypothetical protein
MAIEIEDIKLLVGFYYLATPYTKYTSGLDDAAWDASKVASRVMKRGVAVFCPVSHCHQIALAGRISLVDAEFWMRMQKPIMEIATGILVAGLDGWRDSAGIEKELEWFRRAGRVRFLMDPHTLNCQPLR